MHAEAKEAYDPVEKVDRLASVLQALHRANNLRPARTAGNSARQTTHKPVSGRSAFALPHRPRVRRGFLEKSIGRGAIPVLYLLATDSETPKRIAAS